jgi:hypothetical protein
MSLLRALDAGGGPSAVTRGKDIGGGRLIRYLTGRKKD